MSSNLFQAIQVGDFSLQNRVVLAPLTRWRATDEHVPLSLVTTYYTQRGCRPGTLLITESVTISPKAGGCDNVPGIYNEDQIEAWRKITDSVHAAGSFIFIQIRAYGRGANEAQLLSEDPSFSVVSASDVKLTGRDKAPRPLTIEEIHEYVDLFATAASNAVHKAGFDGIEIHGANGYLIDQFIQDVSNKRTDEYGGSIENRCRFTLEIVDAVAKAVGVKKTAIRLSPWSKFLDMGMTNPFPTFSYLISQLKYRYPELAYIHLVEPRVDGNVIREEITEGESNDPFRKIWSPRPFISAGGYTRESAIQTADEKGDLIAFGRHFISNPDLVTRLEKNLPLTPYDRSTFYVRHDTTGKGYVDYPFATEALQKTVE